jgi:CRISPR-associated protein Cas2
MDILVTYDVSTDTPEGQRRLRKVARTCLDFGQRVQKSVFECSVSEMQFEKLRHRLLECIDEKEDNLRIYRLQQPKDKFVECYGERRDVDFQGPLVI